MTSTSEEKQVDNSLETMRAANLKTPLRPTGFVQFDIYNIIFDYFAKFRQLTITDARIKTAEEFTKALYNGYIKIAARDNLNNENVIMVIVADSSEIPTSASSFESFVGTIKAPTKIMLITRYSFSAFVLKKAKALNIETRLKRYSYDLLKIVIPFAPGAGIHTIMAEEALAKELDFLGIEKSAIKIIFENDPQCCWIGGKPGQVIKIRRNQPQTGESIDYRLVKASPLT